MAATDDPGVSAHPPIAPLRVNVIHPSLAKYRVPVFRDLAQRPGIDLKVFYGTTGGIPNVAPEGFEAIAVPRFERRLGGQIIMFQGAEWSYASRRVSDVVVFRWSPRSLSLLPALIRAKLAGVATVLWGHGFSKTDRPWWQQARKSLADLATAVVLYDPRTRQMLIDEGWDACRLFVAINSLDSRDIDAARNSWINELDRLAQFRKEFSLNARPVVLFVSRLDPRNRVDLLIRATARLVPELPDIRTVIIGNGERERRRLRSLASEMQIENNVVFRDGIYDEMALAPWFLTASVFCYPENVGLSLLHSLWYGLPAVSSENWACQNPEFVALENGINGFTYAHRDVKSLSGRLRQILTDSHLQRSMSKAARSTVEKRFTVSRMVDGLEAAIRYAAGTKLTTRQRPRRIMTARCGELDSCGLNPEQR